MTGRISELTEMTAVANDDYVEIIDQSGTPNNDSRNMRILKQNFGKDIITTKTGSATLTTAEQGVILVNPSTTAMTLTLPAALNNAGVYYKLIYISTTGQPVTIDGNASETINGSTTLLMEHYGQIMELYCDGTNWFALHEMPDNSSTMLITEDFMGRVNVTTAFAGLTWFIQGTNTETAVGFAVVDNNHIGLLQIGTAATAIGDDCAISLSGSATLTSMDFDANWSITWIIRTSDITNITIRFGLVTNSTPASQETTENALFLFDPAVSANWRCRTRQAADQSTTTGIAVANSTFYKLKVVKDGTTIRFYIDNVNAANHATQVPVAACMPVACVENTTAASATTVVLDKMMLYIRGLSGV